MSGEQEDTVYILIGAAIRRLRRQANISQQEFAQTLGLTRTSITNIEAGRQRLPIHTLCTIASLFNVPVSALLQEVFLAPEEQAYARVNEQLRMEVLRLRSRLAKIRTIIDGQPQQEPDEERNTPVREEVEIIYIC